MFLKLMISALVVVTPLAWAQDEWVAPLSKKYAARGQLTKHVFNYLAITGGTSIISQREVPGFGYDMELGFSPSWWILTQVQYRSYSYQQDHHVSQNNRLSTGVGTKYDLNRAAIHGRVHWETVEISEQWVNEQGVVEESLNNYGAMRYTLGFAASPGVLDLMLDISLHHRDYIEEDNHSESEMTILIGTVIDDFSLSAKTLFGLSHDEKMFALSYAYHF